MNIKSILLFIGGLTVGGAAGVFGSKKYFQNKYQKQYEKDHNDLEKYYKMTDVYKRKEHDNKNEKPEESQEPVEGDSKPNGRMSPEERTAIKKKLNKNWKGTTDYAGMYRIKDGYTEEKMAENEHPLDQGEPGEADPMDLHICANCTSYNPDTETCDYRNEIMSADYSCEAFENINEDSPEKDAFEEHQKNKNKPPKIISADAYANLSPNIDQEVLYLYAYDEMLCDENEDPIDEPERFVGDALTKYGFIDNDERVIFVMNYNLTTCYEIQKVDASWTDTH